MKHATNKWNGATLKIIGFGEVNRVLIVIVVGLTAQLIIKFSSIRGATAPLMMGEQEGSIHARDLEEPSRRPFSQYRQKFLTRRLFEPAIDSADTASSSPAQILPPLNERVRVVGVWLDRDPRAIIEDLKEGQTLFLSTGDWIADARVLDIQDDKVIFQYSQERVEMTP